MLHRGRPGRYISLATGPSVCCFLMKTARPARLVSQRCTTSALHIAHIAKPIHSASPHPTMVRVNSTTTLAKTAAPQYKRFSTKTNNINNMTVDIDTEIRNSEHSVPEEPYLPDLEKINLNGLKLSTQVDKVVEKVQTQPLLEVDFTSTKTQKAASVPLRRKARKNETEMHPIIDDSSATNLIPANCCGGGCCRLQSSMESRPSSPSFVPCDVPDNEAFRKLGVQLTPLSKNSKLSGTTLLPAKSISFEKVFEEVKHVSTVGVHPPTFVTPHPPYEVFSAKIAHARCLTAKNAQKRTYHFDLDVTDYPEELPGVDFRVGGAVGVCAPNDPRTVDAIFNILAIPEAERDEPIVLHTQGGRWPTIWGQEAERKLTTTRRELLTWTVDIQSYAPTKQILRVLAEYATDEDQKKILLYLCSRQGQAAFCELRTGAYITLSQLLHAFPSAKPPLDHLLCVLQQLMPRFYSLSSDPTVSKQKHIRTIEMAVTVHEVEDWSGSQRTGVGSGFFERMAEKFIETEESGQAMMDLRIPMFRGLMENPMAKEFQADGPMLLIGAGVGVAPFRGFVQRRLQNANCVNKVYVMQGIRDSLLDQLYAGEWGVHESEVTKVVESRKGTGQYVQDEVLREADTVWWIINSLDGRIFVCGSTKGMGEGVHDALIEVSMLKGNLNRSEAEEFWQKKKAAYQYVTETW